MTGEQLMRRDRERVLPTYARFPVALASGHGATAVDFEGREYIDFTSGIGVNSLGFCDPQWADAVAAQARTLQHTSNLFYTGPCVEVAELLCARTGMRKVFFANSGAEANEGAIKAARKYSFLKYGEGRATVVTLVNSFHGRTVTTLSATGQEVFHQYFFPFTEGFRHVEANDFDALKAALTADVCAVLVEPVQGEGGVLPLDREYLQKTAALCAGRDVLLLVDEVQTGIGRTGTLFAFEQFGIRPDIVTCAKGIGGGLPLGAVLFGEKAENALGPGDHATTFGGNPVACAGAKAVLSRLDEAFLAGVRAKAEMLRARIAAMPHVGSISGLGLMVGVTLEGAAARDAVYAGFEKGVLLLTAKTKLRLLPPLTITEAELQKGLDALEAALASL